MNNEPVTIIGGGIGGLTLANALSHYNIPFELYEQAPKLTEIGAGIGLTEAPISIFEMLGLASRLRDESTRLGRVCFPDKQLNIRRKISAEFEMICIHRARLIDILKSTLPANKIHLSKRLVAINTHENGTILRFEDGEKISARTTVAADGIHSTVRNQLFPRIPIRYINQTIWRGISSSSLPDKFQNSYLEIWDEGLRFLALPFEENQTFWLGIKPAPPGGRDNPETIIDDLLDLFQNFHPDLKELIRTTGPVLRNDMADLGTQKRQWFKNRVVFLGDAIHATTPNLGQGGCQAIEDAWCLAKLLQEYPDDFQTACQRYQHLRQKKVMKIVADSWRFGKASHSKNTLFHYGYRFILTHAPEFVIRRQEQFLNRLDYLQKI
ncbi:MAG: hypothetical protein EA390_14775 [Balneolaceae bacterium]|nr:MAG: hypothetical protein EA390_14775 [Balneolaceae bacterium]